jgi:hypothetical protein
MKKSTPVINADVHFHELGMTDNFNAKRLYWTRAPKERTTLSASTNRSHLSVPLDRIKTIRSLQWVLISSSAR